MKHSLQIFIFLIVVVLLNTNVMGQPLFEAYNSNPVLGKGQSGEWDSQVVFLPKILVTDSLFYLFYTGDSQTPPMNTFAIGYAYSNDGYHFTKDTANNPILCGDGSGFDSTSVMTGAILMDGDSLVLYYSALGVGRASATHPAGPWNRLDSPVLQTGNAGEWDEGFIEAYSVIKDSNTYIMFYTGGDVPPPGIHNYRIGMATSADGINWIKYDDSLTTTAPYADSDPVLKPGPTGSWDDFAVWQPSVIKPYGLYEMFYLGSTSSSADIGYAYSSDGIDWTKPTGNPIYSISDDPYAVSSGGIIESPAVGIKNNQYFMYYDYGVFVGEIGLAITPPDGLDNFSDLNPKSIYLNQNYPNPFNPTTTIEFNIPKTEFVTLKIYNLLGQKVATLVSDRLTAGSYTYNWDASSLASGLYIYKIQAGTFQQVRKMLYLK